MMAKTNAGLVEYAMAQLGLPYWYGTFGNIGTEELYKSKKKQYPQYYKWEGTPYDNFPQQYGKRVHDCVGLIKGYLWSDSPTAKPRYASGGYPDLSANQMRYACKFTGGISSIPDIPGVLVFMVGHVGVYIGGGFVIEARGHEYGVVRTSLKSRPWKWWGKCPYIEYIEASDTAADIKLKVKSGKWHVRTAPNVDGKVLRVVGEGTTLYADRSDPVSGWFHVPSLEGWISYKAVERA